MTLSPGTTLGHYQILEPIGAGGMARVYKAFHPALARIVALKVLRPDFAEDPSFLDRFRREARSVAGLEHPNIVPVYDFDEANGLAFMAMQYLDGGTLKAHLDKLGASGERLSSAEAVRILEQIAEGLAFAHSKGLLHRDIKPSNILFASDGKAVLGDFGIARSMASDFATRTGVGIGTPEYMSPEQARGLELDARSDVYALGVVAYELLTGGLPFVADTPFAVALSHVRDPLPLPSSRNPQLSSAIERVLLRALAKDTGDRYSTATEFAAALSAASREPGVANQYATGTFTPAPLAATPLLLAPAVPARPAFPPTRRATPHRRRVPRALVPIAAAAALLAFVVGAYGATLAPRGVDPTPAPYTARPVVLPLPSETTVRTPTSSPTTPAPATQSPTPIPTQPAPPPPTTVRPTSAPTVVLPGLPGPVPSTTCDSIGELATTGFDGYVRWGGVGVSGVRVEIAALASADPSQHVFAAGNTGSDGYFKITGAPPGVEYALSVPVQQQYTWTAISARACGAQIVRVGPISIFKAINLTAPNINTTVLNAPVAVGPLTISWTAVDGPVVYCVGVQYGDPLTLRWPPAAGNCQANYVAVSGTRFTTLPLAAGTQISIDIRAIGGGFELGRLGNWLSFRAQ